MKIVSWNVNGLRAVHKNGYWDKFISKLPADIYCIQETKARPEQLSEELKNLPSYKSFFNYPTHKKGYAGIALYVKESLKNYEILDDFGPSDFDTQGRMLGISLTDKNLVLLNLYFPNGGMGPKALQYKLQFYEYFLDFVANLKNAGKSVIITGDFNVAHTEIDLAEPEKHKGSVGFLPEERAYLDELEAIGFVDMWRHLHPSEQKYTWWSMRTKARERNVGWRIDYFFVSEDLISFVKDCKILNEIYGSDHCPVLLDLGV